MHSTSLAVSIALRTTAVFAAISGGVHAQVTLRTLGGVPPAGSSFGQSVSGVGDIDGDGYSDVLVGDPRHFGNDDGAAYVFSGRNGAVLYTFSGSRKELLGRSVNGVGDVNGDLIPDFAIGSPGTATGEPEFLTGTVRVHSGADGAVIHQWSGDAIADRFGIYVCGAGDVNGDGRADVCVIAGGNNPGYVRVFSGASGGILHAFGISASAACAAGDLDGDGKGDLVLGLHGLQDSLVVLSGADGTAILTVSGVFGEGFGFSVAAAGDLNGDGFPDFIAGASGTYPLGSVRVISGADGSRMYTFFGDQSGDRFGYPVASAGDYDGDGTPDIMASALQSSSSHNYVRIFSGRTGAVIHTIMEDPPAGLYGEFGFSIASSGDTNNDGFADIIIGNYQNNCCAPSSYARIVSSIRNRNQVPIADAGPDQNSSVTYGISLDGRGSVDDDWDALTWQWALVGLPAGSASALTGSTTPTPSFVADLPGVYTVSLVVNDGFVDSLYDYVTITVTLNTPVGTNVVVQPVDTTTGQIPVTVTFDNVTSTGTTSLTTSSSGPPPASGFRLGAPPTYYEVSTTATFTGTFEICIQYNAGSFNSQNLELFHRLPNGTWEIITTSHDPGARVICGRTTSFSAFAIVAPQDAIGIIEFTITTVVSLNLRNNIENSLDAKLNAAVSALLDAHVQNNVAAINALNAFVNAVIAQSGNWIPTVQADRLIRLATSAIALLGS